MIMEVGDLVKIRIKDKQSKMARFDGWVGMVRDYPRPGTGIWAVSVRFVHWEDGGWRGARAWDDRDVYYDSERPWGNWNAAYFSPDNVRKIPFCPTCKSIKKEEKGRITDPDYDIALPTDFGPPRIPCPNNWHVKKRKVTKPRRPSYKAKSANA